MNKPVHQVAGVATTLAVAALLPLQTTIGPVSVIPLIGVLSAPLSSIFADIDIERSSMGHKFPLGAKIFTHRGLTHTLLFPAIPIVAMFFVGIIPVPILATILASLLFGFSVGYLSHIFADAFNGKGVPLFWPVIRNKVNFADFASSGAGAVAWLVLYLLVLLAVVFFFAPNQYIAQVRGLLGL